MSGRVNGLNSLRRRLDMDGRGEAEGNAQDASVSPPPLFTVNARIAPV